MIGGPPIPMPRAQAPVQSYVPPRLESPKASAPKLLARGQSDDAPPAVRIPTPEELGLGTGKPESGDAPLDWSMVERRLDAAGATGYQVEKTGTGFRFTCQLASGAVSGRGMTKGEAVRNTLAKLPR
jgi:hypothetical protein